MNKLRLSRVGIHRLHSMAHVRSASSERRFTFASMFAGGSGTGLGFRFAGGDGVLANEFVAEAIRTYRANCPDCIVDPRDIREISFSDGDVAGFLARARLYIGEIDVVEGSPPCCEYSYAGRGIGDQEVLRPYSDVTQNNIASLPFDLADFVHRAKPKVFVCENVPAFETRARNVFHRFLHYLCFGGVGSDRLYYATSAVLVASDYGVAQKRQRLFVMGVRKDVGDAVGFNSNEAVRDLFPVPTELDVSVRTALVGLT